MLKFAPNLLTQISRQIPQSVVFPLQMFTFLCSLFNKYCVFITLLLSPNQIGKNKNIKHFK